LTAKIEDLLLIQVQVFFMITTEERANKITEDKVIDSLKISS
jgi:hypothetical protein